MDLVSIATGSIVTASIPLVSKGVHAPLRPQALAKACHSDRAESRCRLARGRKPLPPTRISGEHALGTDGVRLYVQALARRVRRAHPRAMSEEF